MEEESCNKCTKKDVQSNNMFGDTIELQKHTSQQNAQNRLTVLDQEANQQLIIKPLLSYNFTELENGFYNNMTGLMDDLINKPFNINFFTEGNRMFFLGILLLLIVFGIFLLGLIF